jgi:hypothetical protein
MKQRSQVNRALYQASMHRQRFFHEISYRGRQLGFNARGGSYILRLIGWCLQLPLAIPKLLVKIGAACILSMCYLRSARNGLVVILIVVVALISAWEDTERRFESTQANQKAVEHKRSHAKASSKITASVASKQGAKRSERVE